MNTLILNWQPKAKSWTGPLITANGKVQTLAEYFQEHKDDEDEWEEEAEWPTQS